MIYILLFFDSISTYNIIFCCYDNNQCIIVYFTGVFSNCSYEEETRIEKFKRIFCSWKCCPAFYKFQNIVELFILDPFVDLFITICILVNTGFLGADHYNMSDELRHVLENGNYVNINYYYLTVGWLMVFNATFNNISVISWRSVLLVEKTIYLTLSTDIDSNQNIQFSLNISYKTTIFQKKSILLTNDYVFCSTQPYLIVVFMLIRLKMFLLY